MYIAEHESAHEEPRHLQGSLCLAEGGTSDVDLERARGAGRIVFAGDGDGTRISDVDQKFPVALAFPDTDRRQSREAVIINCSGGIAGGDRFEIEVIAQSGSSATVTTQAAEKVYRALDCPAEMASRLEVQPRAKLAWLPQELIVFDAARIRRKTDVELHSGAELLLLEWIVLGRTRSGEEVRRGYVLDSWRVKLDGRLVWADGFLVSDDVFSHLHLRALLSKSRAVGTLIYFGPSLTARLEVLRDIATSLDCKCAATIVGAIIIVRVAAIAGNDLKRALRRLLDQFSQELQCESFGVPKMWSC